MHFLSLIKFAKFWQNSVELDERFKLGPESLKSGLRQPITGRMLRVRKKNVGFKKFPIVNSRRVLRRRKNCVTDL